MASPEFRSRFNGNYILRSLIRIMTQATQRTEPFAVANGSQHSTPAEARQLHCSKDIAVLRSDPLAPLLCFSGGGVGESWILWLTRPCENSEIPPTAVGGLFKSSLQGTRPETPLANPTHGSGWIVQVLPTRLERSKIGRAHV